MRKQVEEYKICSFRGRGQTGVDCNVTIGIEWWYCRTNNNMIIRSHLRTKKSGVNQVQDRKKMNILADGTLHKKRKPA